MLLCIANSVSTTIFWFFIKSIISSENWLFLLLNPFAKHSSEQYFLFSYFGLLKFCLHDGQFKIWFLWLLKQSTEQYLLVFFLYLDTSYILLQKKHSFIILSAFLRAWFFLLHFIEQYLVLRDGFILISFPQPPQFKIFVLINGFNSVFWPLIRQFVEQYLLVLILILGT